MTKGTQEAASEHPLVGQTLRGTYRVLRLLDRGGMGLVFEAEHLRLKSLVAIKVLPHHLLRDRHALERFRHEAEIVAQLKHPHVVHVMDCDASEEQQPFLVMELLTGESLAERLDRERRLPLHVVVRIAVQTASALSAVHTAAVVHRDLKPANVFLCAVPGELAWVKLLDFGISRRIHSGHGLTGEHDVMGTPDYMSPELALGRAASADHRSDQYSLAVIVYEMLAGRLPFLGDGEMEILTQVIASRAPSLRLLLPSLPARVCAVVERAMSKLPEERFENMDGFSAALAQAAGASLSPGATPAATLRLTSDPAVLSADAVLRAAEVSPPTLPRRDSGLRPRTPESKHETVRGVSPLDRLRTLLGRIERGYATGDIEGAAELVEQALTTAERMDPQDAESVLSQTRELLVDVLEVNIGKLGRRLRTGSPPSGAPHALSPQEAFLLANAGERYTIEELIDSSPLKRLETLRLIARLLRAGWLR